MSEWTRHSCRPEGRGTRGMMNPGGNSRTRDIGAAGGMTGHEGAMSLGGADGSKGLAGVLGSEECNGAEGYTLGGPFIGRW